MSANILATCPGKFGDIAWALPTCRALATAAGVPVDLQISGAYGSIAPLLIAQPYIGAVLVDPDWEVRDTAPMTPRTPPQLLTQADQVYHLGYESWPHPTLAEDVYGRVNAMRFFRGYARLPDLDLGTPWITLDPRVAPPYPAPSAPPRVWIGWSEEWFECKVGILASLAIRFPQVDFWWIRPWGGRYDEVDPIRCAGDTRARLADFANLFVWRSSWEGAAALGASCDLYLGCLSAAWVLADGMGKPVVAVEPNPNRHHEVFWRQAEKNRLVRGNDGKGTHDSRHAGDALQAVLATIRRLV